MLEKTKQMDYRLTKRSLQINKDNQSAASLFSQAQYQLSRQTVEEGLLFRQKQMQKIRQFIIKFITTGHSKQSLYISGVPGLGKTLSVLKIIKQFQNQQAQHNVKFVKINAIKLYNQQNIYKILYQELFGNKNKKKQKQNILNTYNAIIKLDHLFRNSYDEVQLQIKKLRETKKILLIDEIDYLKTQKQQILYNLFEWTQSQTSNFAIIAISNSIYFPQKLKIKIRNRIGNCRLVFFPFNSTQIEKIINLRIQRFQIFQPYAINYIAKQVCKSTCDTRKCFTLVKQAIQLHIKKTPTEQLKNSKITLAQLNEFYQNKDYQTQCIKKMPKIYQQVLWIMSKHFRQSIEFLYFNDIQQIAQKEYKLNSSDVEQTLANLIDLGLVAKKKRFNKYQNFRNQNYILLFRNWIFDVNPQLDQALLENQNKVKKIENKIKNKN